MIDRMSKLCVVILRSVHRPPRWAEQIQNPAEISSSVMKRLRGRGAIILSLHSTMYSIEEIVVEIFSDLAIHNRLHCCYHTFTRISSCQHPRSQGNGLLWKLFSSDCTCWTHGEESQSALGFSFSRILKSSSRPSCRQNALRRWSWESWEAWQAKCATTFPLLFGRWLHPLKVGFWFVLPPFSCKLRLFRIWHRESKGNSAHLIHFGASQPSGRSLVFRWVCSR